MSKDLRKEKERREIGDRLKDLRIRKGLTMEEMANKVGAFGRSVVSNWEKGKTTPKHKFMEAYANFFQVPIEWIKYGDYDSFIKTCISEYAEVISGEEMPLIELKQGIIIINLFNDSAYNRAYESLLPYTDKIKEVAEEKNIGYDFKKMIDLIADVVSSTNIEAFSIVKNLEDSFYHAIFECQDKGEVIPEDIEQFADEFMKSIAELKKII